MTRSRLGTPGLLTRHLAGGGAVSLLLPLLVFVSVLAVALAPRALTQVSTAELQHELTQQSPLLLDLVGSGLLGIPFGDPNFGPEYLTVTVDPAIQSLRDSLPQPLRAATEPGSWVARTMPDVATKEPLEVEPLISLAIDLSWQQRILIVAGKAPAEWAGPTRVGAATSADGTAPIEVAMSRASAEAIGLEVGDVLDYRPAALVITALFQPLDATDPYWVHAADLATPAVFSEERGQIVVRSAVYLAPGSIGKLAQEFAVGELAAWIPLDPTAITHRNAADVAGQIRSVSVQTASLPFAGELSFRSGTPALIEKSTTRIAAMSALIALSVSGLVGVLIAVFALGVRSVLARRAPPLRLAAARGAGEWQLRGAMVLEGLLLSVPAGIAGIAMAAVIVPEPFDPTAVIVPAAVALVPAVLFGLLTSARPTAARRTDLVSRGHRRARLITETATAGLAVVALVLLARRGLVGPSVEVGVDPLLSATPLLLAVTACLGALRLYPLALQALNRAMRRGGDASAVVGAARAMRDPALGFATALALVVGVSIVVFSTVMASTVRAGLTEQATDQVGADVRVAAARVDAATVDAVRALNDVGAAVALSTTTEVPFADSARERVATVVIADSAALHAVRSDIPALSGVGDRVPVIVSSAWGSLDVGSEATLGEAPVVVSGIVDETALPGLGREWVLVDAAAADQLGIDLVDADTLLVRVASGAEPSRVAERAAKLVQDAQPVAQRAGVVATDVATTVAASRTPIVDGLEAALVIAALASLALMMTTIMLATVTAAAARNRLLSVLRVIGMSSPQLRRLLSWELGPLAAVAVAVGTVLGLALPVIVTSVLDLRPFIGGTAVPRAVVEPISVLFVLVVFAVTVAIAALVALALGRRLAPAGILRMGDSA